MEDNQVKEINKWKIYAREYARLNKDKKSEYDRLYRQRPEVKDRIRKYRIENKEKLRQQQQEWKRQNPDKVRRNSEKDRKNRKEKIINYMREYQTRRHVKIKHALTDRIRNELHGYLKDKKHKTIDYLGCLIPDFILYLESKFQKGQTWNNYGKNGWHIDHIIPCNSFDLSKEEEQKKCFHYSNLQPLWATTEIARSYGCFDCIGNLNKNAKLIY